MIPWNSTQTILKEWRGFLQNNKWLPPWLMKICKVKNSFGRFQHSGRNLLTHAEAKARAARLSEVFYNISLCLTSGTSTYNGTVVCHFKVGNSLSFNSFCFFLLDWLSTIIYKNDGLISQLSDTVIPIFLDFVGRTITALKLNDVDLTSKKVCLR